MSVASALKFIQQVRADTHLKSQIESLGPASELDAVLKIGRVAGFIFTEAELRQAFKHDWSMRWLRYGGASRPAAGAAPARSERDPQGFEPP